MLQVVLIPCVKWPLKPVPLQKSLPILLFRHVFEGIQGLAKKEVAIQPLISKRWLLVLVATHYVVMPTFVRSSAKDGLFENFFADLGPINIREERLLLGKDVGVLVLREVIEYPLTHGELQLPTLVTPCLPSHFKFLFNELVNGCLRGVEHHRGTFNSLVLCHRLLRRGKP